MNKLCLALVSCAALAPSSAWAQSYVVSNLDLSNTNQTTVSDNAWGATSFTTDAGSYQFNSMTARFRGSLDVTDSTYTVRLFRDLGGVPGTPITALQTPNPTVAKGSFSELTWTPQSPQTLSPLTTYWFVFGGTTGGAVNTTNSPAQTGQWTIGDFVSFSNNDTTYSSTPNGISLQFGINATPTASGSPAAPEPSSVALIVLPVVGAIVARWKKNR